MGKASSRRISAFLTTAGSARNARAKSTESAPQNSSPPLPASARRRKLERDAEALRPPVAPAVGVAALGLDLGRALLAEVGEQSGEEHRAALDREPRRQPGEPVQADIGKGRNEVEIPDRRPHGLLC
jgi:hypothetical protein